MARISIEPPAGSRSNVTSTESSAIGCASGISDGVCFAASTPAILAVVSTSPFGSARSTRRLSVAGCMRTVATATASRVVARLEPTWTMEMPPVSSRCEKSFIESHRLLELFGSVYVEQRLACKTRAQLGFGNHFFDHAAHFEAMLRDARFDQRLQRRVVHGAQRLRLASPHRHAAAIAQVAQDL